MMQACKYSSTNLWSPVKVEGARVCGGLALVGERVGQRSAACCRPWPLATICRRLRQRLQALAPRLGALHRDGLWRRQQQRVAAARIAALALPPAVWRATSS